MLKEISVTCRSGLQNFTAWQVFVRVTAMYCLHCATAGDGHPALWGYASWQGAAPTGNVHLLLAA